MLLDLDVSGHTVLVLGSPHAARRAVRRYAAAGAVVRTRTEPGGPTEIPRSVGAGPDSLGGSVTLVVDVTGGDPAWDEDRRELRRHAILVPEAPAGDDPLVTLVGGGPGTPELLTVAARWALADADVVLVDRLATHEDNALLEALAPGAEVIDVGKTPGRHKIPQSKIEEIMVTRASAGQHVVRLKGGDPFVFGRGGEEMEAAHAAGVPVEIVPGITSAIAVPASIGVPVTSRDITRLFTVVSGHDPLTEELCAHLTGLGGTIVILMGMGTLIQNVTGLMRAGLGADTPVAVIQEGFTPRQRSLIATVATVAQAVAQARFSSPAVVVIGEVVRSARS